ncbi:hypothetical protein QET93_009145 [Akkermansia sp. N21116]|uniref:hypothetical protein n=1 Tax=Akkermansia sp. N21116 TaxID=3040764 RepID=UPI00244E71C5|nr:hypothetical protein [Akkermansia sp. N21116]WPX39701.1 hypothetical protein QET93_009145 [Akkermansia sp. N21116]
MVNMFSSPHFLLSASRNVLVCLMIISPGLSHDLKATATRPGEEHTVQQFIESQAKPSSRIKREICLHPLNVTLSKGAKQETFCGQSITGGWNYKGASMKAKLPIPATGTYVIEITYTKAVPESLALTITSGTKKETWEIPSGSTPYLRSAVLGSVLLSQGTASFSVTMEKAPLSDTVGAFGIAAVHFIPLELADENSIFLRPEAASLFGGTRIETKHISPIIGYFDRKGAGASWKLNLQQAGTYLAEIDYDSAHNPGKLMSIKSETSPPFYWRTLKTIPGAISISMPIGVFTLPAGPGWIGFRVEEPFQLTGIGGVMGFNLLKLRRLTSAEASSFSLAFKGNTQLPSGNNQQTDRQSSTSISPPPLTNIPLHSEFSKVYAKKRDVLQRKYISSLKKFQQKYAKSQNFSVVSIIQEMINAPESSLQIATLPQEISRLAIAYKNQREQIDEQVKQAYLKTLKQSQAQYAQKQQFDKIVEIQEAVKIVEKTSPSELFTDTNEE